MRAGEQPIHARKNAENWQGLYRLQEGVKRARCRSKCRMNTVFFCQRFPFKRGPVSGDTARSPLKVSAGGKRYQTSLFLFERKKAMNAEDLQFWKHVYCASLAGLRAQSESDYTTQEASECARKDADMAVKCLELLKEQTAPKAVINCCLFHGDCDAADSESEKNTGKPSEHAA